VAEGVGPELNPQCQKKKKKKYGAKRTGGVAQATERLLSKCETLSPTQKKKKPD
jgi:hypothetical protein